MKALDDQEKERVGLSGESSASNESSERVAFLSGVVNLDLLNLENKY